jgi:hypothetical protein
MTRLTLVLFLLVLAVLAVRQGVSWVCAHQPVHLRAPHRGRHVRRPIA